MEQCSEKIEMTETNPFYEFTSNVSIKTKTYLIANQELDREVRAKLRLRNINQIFET